jgi:hypothetical protein
VTGDPERPGDPTAVSVSLSTGVLTIFDDPAPDSPTPDEENP